jgi:hypothetical protein
MKATKQKSHANVLKGRNQVNKNQKGMNIEELLNLGNKESLIMINQDRNPEGLHHKENHSLVGM